MYNFLSSIIESKDEKFPVGSHVWGYFGWCSHTIFNTSKVKAGDENLAPYILPPHEKLPYSLGLGILGMPGYTLLRLNIKWKNLVINS